MKKFFQWLLPADWMTVQHVHECNHVYVEESSLKDPGNMLQVVIVNDEKATISETLGITPERYEELTLKCKHIALDVNTITDGIADISKECKHANELAMSTILIYHATRPDNGGGFPGFLQAIMGQRPHGPSGPDSDNDA